MHLCARGEDCALYNKPPTATSQGPLRHSGAHILQSNKLVIPPSAIKDLHSKWALYPSLLPFLPPPSSFSCLIPKFYIIPPATALIITHPTEHGVGVRGPFTLRLVVYLKSMVLVLSVRLEVSIVHPCVLSVPTSCHPTQRGKLNFSISQSFLLRLLHIMFTAG